MSSNKPPAEDRVQPLDPEEEPRTAEATKKGGLHPPQAPDMDRQSVHEPYGRGHREGSRTAIRESGRESGREEDKGKR